MDSFASCIPTNVMRSGSRSSLSLLLHLPWFSQEPSDNHFQVIMSFCRFALFFVPQDIFQDHVGLLINILALLVSDQGFQVIHIFRSAMDYMLAAGAWRKQLVGRFCALWDCVMMKAGILSLQRAKMLSSIFPDSLMLYIKK